MTYWLLKSEPSVYSWDQMIKDKKTNWNGVRNHQAAAHLKAMRIDDQAFFYHSNEGKNIVGIVKVIKEAYPDPTDQTGKFVMVDVAPLKALKNPVDLAALKAEPKLKNLQLIRQGRLSVCRITEEEWQTILKMAA